VRPALGHVDAVKTELLGVAGKAGNHVGAGLKGSEPDTDTHARKPEP
jgi:hypothetical protein